MSKNISKVWGVVTNSQIKIFYGSHLNCQYLAVNNPRSCKSLLFIWCPYKKGDIELVEKVQKRATYIIKAFTIYGKIKTTQASYIKI